MRFNTINMKLVKLSDHSVDISLIDDNSIVFDCGAYKGDFLRDLLKYNKKCKVYMYEPNYRLTTIQSRYGDLANTTLINKAISNTINKRNLYIGMKSGPGWIKSTGSSLDRSHDYCTDKHLRVETTTIEEEMNRLNIENIDLLKLDIEGEEIRVIPSLSEETLNRINQITMEYHLHSNIDNYTNDKVILCRRYLKSSGFKEVKYNNSDSLYIRRELL